METTTFTVPTIFLVIILFAVGAALIGYKLYKDKKNGGDIDIEKYFPNIISVVQKVISILSVNLSSFNTREEYMNCIVGMTIDYLKQDAIEFDIPVALTSMISTEYLTSIITDLISKYYFECFSILTVNEVSEHQELFNDEFVECKCGKENCHCKEGNCDCE